MKINHIKLLTIAAFFLLAFVVLSFQNDVALVRADDNATEALYKKSCLMCHKPDASKAFNATKADAELEKAILDGVEAKPIKMPEFKSKGVDEAKAKELVVYMKAKAAAAAKPPANTAATEK